MLNLVMYLLSQKPKSQILNIVVVLMSKAKDTNFEFSCVFDVRSKHKMFKYT